MTNTTIEQDAGNERELAGCTFANTRATTPTSTGKASWRTVINALKRRSIRPEKNGRMMGCYALKEGGTRCNEDVLYRSCTQLDIDTEGTKEKNGQIIKVTKKAPTLDEIRAAIDEFEYVATSSHWHEPHRGVIKYRVTILLDRDIEESEYKAVLEALDRILGKVLDRGAWQWSQAFFLPSCPEENEQYAFYEHNKGISLPVDEFVRQGREILGERGKRPNSPVADALREDDRGLEETPENIALVRGMLVVLPANCGRDEWMTTSFSVASLDWECGKELVREWSETAPDIYEEDVFDTLWESYEPGRPGGITVGTLFHLATEAGWVNQQAVLNIVDPTQHMTGLGGDISNGKHFALIYRDKLIFVPELGLWLVFDESVGWVKAPFGEVEQAAKAVVQQMREHAAELYKEDPEGKKTKALMSHVERSSKMPNLLYIIDASKSEPRMAKSLTDFDADPEQLGLVNGILDLRTQKVLSTSPDVLVTKRCGVAYDPAADCPLFEIYLREVQPDPVIRFFLQRFVGYLLTGSVNEQVFVFFYGHGANGKSVFIELLAWLMGDYSRKIPTEMLMRHQRNPQGPSPDIVALKGIRLAFANETDEGRRLDEARVKDLTGGDSLTGRVPYAKADITFQPTHTLIMVGNHKPDIADTSNGMWRRVLLVKWDTCIPEHQQDKQLLQKLKSEGPGILNWALDGLRKWKQNGLQIPKQIRAATQEYRNEQDVLGEWLAENCNTGAGCKEEKKLLYSAYRNWTQINGHYPMSQTRLTRELNERKLQLQADKRTVAGVELKPDVRIRWA